MLMHEIRPPEPRVAPAPYVLLSLAATITGLTLKAMRRKIEEGIWLEGREYLKGPDGHIYLSMEGFARWVEKGLASK